ARQATFTAALRRDKAFHYPTIPPCFLLKLSSQPPSAILFPYTTLFRSSTTGRPKWSCTRRRRRATSTASFCEERSQPARPTKSRSEEHTSELQSRENLVCRLLLEKKKAHNQDTAPTNDIHTIHQTRNVR